MQKTWMVKTKKSDAWINLRAKNRASLFKKAEKRGIKIMNYRINSEWIKNNGEKIGTARIVVNDDGAYPTMGDRPLYETPNGGKFVKFDGKFWKYPEGVDR